MYHSLGPRVAGTIELRLAHEMVPFLVIILVCVDVFIHPLKCHIITVNQYVLEDIECLHRDGILCGGKLDTRPKQSDTVFAKPSNCWSIWFTALRIK